MEKFKRKGPWRNLREGAIECFRYCIPGISKVDGHPKISRNVIQLNSSTHNSNFPDITDYVKTGVSICVYNIIWY